MTRNLRMTEEQLLARKKRQHDEDSKATVAARFNKPLEADVQRAVLAYLGLHPKVAMVWRSNTGTLPVGERYVSFGFKGCSDLIGMLTDGRFLAVEVKREGKEPTDEQRNFLKNVLDNKGVALWCDSLDSCIRQLELQL